MYPEMSRLLLNKDFCCNPICICSSFSTVCTSSTSRLFFHIFFSSSKSCLFIHFLCTRFYVQDEKKRKFSLHELNFSSFFFFKYTFHMTMTTRQYILYVSHVSMEVEIILFKKNVLLLLQQIYKFLSWQIHTLTAYFVQQSHFKCILSFNCFHAMRISFYLNNSIT